MELNSPGDTLDLNKMLTVTELARRVDTTQHAVRYYTRLGLLKPVRDPRNNYRLYYEQDVKSLRFVQQAKHLGYTLGEIRDIMDDADQKHSPCPRVREILQRRIKENRQKLEYLMELQQRMEKALLTWDDMPDGIPDGHSVCHLIESIAYTPPDKSAKKGD